MIFQLLKEKLGLNWKRMPLLSIWQKFVGKNIETAAFDEKVGEYFHTLSSEERQIYNFGGKAVC